MKVIYKLANTMSASRFSYCIMGMKDLVQELDFTLNLGRNLEIWK
jgi:hypothetical protein